MIKKMTILLFLNISIFTQQGFANTMNKTVLQSNQLQQELMAISQTFPGVVGLYLHDLNTNQEIELNADERFPMASTFKIPVLIQLYRDKDAGLLSLNEQITITEEIKIMGSGLLKHFSNGTSLTLHDLALLMITISDNTATDIIIDRVKLSRTNSTLENHHIGPMKLHRSTRQLLDDFSTMTIEEKMTNLRDTTTPRAMGKLFEHLLLGKLASKESTNEIKTLLHQQLLNTRMPRSISNLIQIKDSISTHNGVKIAHKTGTTLVATNDVGFIEIPNHREIILCIYTKKDPNKVATYQADQVIGDLTKHIIESLSL